jgi:RNA polymerase sigma-70 factor (ECF subfamily)
VDHVTQPPADTTTVLTRASNPRRPAFEMFAPVEPGYDGPTYHASVEEPPSSPPPPPAASVPLDMQSTVDLLTLAKTGDDRAVDALFERCVPPLRRWARGRLPSGARGLLETQDVVQDAVFNVLRRLDKFEARHHGALLAYLRQAVLNRIRDEARTLARRPAPVELDDQHPAGGASPLELAIDHNDLERYEAALARLRPSDREAIVLRIEMQESYEEVARALGRPNANAARTFVVRALYKLYQEMSHGE